MCVFVTFSYTPCVPVTMCGCIPSSVSSSLTLTLPCLHLQADTETTVRSINVHITQGGEAIVVQVDALLVATGRRPTVRGLGLEAAGVTYSKRTGVEINDKLQTSNKNVFAVGDCATRYQFTHIAGQMGAMVGGWLWVTIGYSHKACALSCVYTGLLLCVCVQFDSFCVCHIV
jgi:NADH dehydrogenase FAD-containing subunit